MSDRGGPEDNGKERSRRSSRLNSGSSNNSKSQTTSSVSSSSNLMPVEEMYKVYERISAADDKATLQKDYRVFFTSVSKSENEKRLASQFIPRFIDSFPDLAQEAFDALLDLCEDDDIMIRRQVVKDLVTACQKLPKFVPKMADVLGQMMETSDSLELAGIERTLTSLFHIDSQGTMVGLLNQITTGEDLTQERAVKFLVARVKDLGPEIISLGFERSLFNESKRYIQNADGDGFEEVIKILTTTKFYKTISGQQALVDLLAGVALVDPFDASGEDKVHRLIVATNYSMEVFSSQINSAPWVVYYCTKVLPKMPEINNLPEGRELRNGLAKKMANLAHYLSRMEEADANECLTVLFSNLKLQIIDPPESGSTSDYYIQDGEGSEDPDYCYIEYLMYTFHKISSFQNNFLLQDPETLPEYRRRLQYLARGTQAAMKTFSADLPTVKGEELRTESNVHKVLTLKVLANLNSMIRDLFRNPPTFKSDQLASWIPVAKPNKRKFEAAGSNSAAPKTQRVDRERQLYQPPSGKFSARGGRGGFGIVSSASRGGGSSRGYRGGGFRSFKR